MLNRSWRFRCPRGVIFLLLVGGAASAAAFGEVSPVIWREAESFDDSFEVVLTEKVPCASGGAVLDPTFARSIRNWVCYDVDVPEEIANPLLILRYASTWDGTCRVLVEVDGQLPAARPASLLVQTTGSGDRPGDYACTAVKLASMPAGARRIRLMPIDAAIDNQDAASTEESRETPSSLQDKTTQASSDEAPCIRIDGFFLTDASTPVPNDLWTFQTLWHAAVSRPSAGERGRVEADSPFFIQPVDPWIAIDRALEWFPVQSTAPGEWVLEGNVNEFISGAAMVTRMGNAPAAMVTLEGDELSPRTQLRIAGQYLSRWYGPVFDPLFTAREIESLDDLSEPVVNWASLRDWPRLRFSKYQTHMVWLTFDARGLEPGQYTGKLILQAGDQVRQGIPVRIRIRPIVLPVDNPLLSYAFSPCPQAEDEIKDRIEHGINVFRSSPYANGGLDVPQNHRTAMRLGAKFILYNYSTAWGLKPIESDARREEARQCVRDLVASAAALGLARDQWAAQMSDEPNSKHIEIIQEYAALAREVDPSIRLWLDPGWSGHFSGSVAESHGLETLFKPLENDIDVWCPFVAHLWREDEPIYEYLRSTGKELWFYKNASIWSKQPNAGFGWYRKVSWIAFWYRTRAAGLWNLAYFMGDPWNDFDKRYPDGAFTYQGQGEHLIGSRVYESYRQGVQEYKRLWWLDQLLQQALESGDSSLKQEARHAREVLSATAAAGMRANTARAMSEARIDLDDAIEHWQERLGKAGDAWSSPRWKRP